MNVYVSKFSKIGTDKNHETLPDGTVRTWDHLYLELPSKFVDKSNRSIGDIQGSSHIDTIKTSHNIRYKYYAVGTEFTGTIFTDLRDDTISNYTPFYNNFTIDETVKHVESHSLVGVFWFSWILLTAVAVFGFYYIDNRWLD